MNAWLNHFKVNPIPILLAISDEALVYFTRRDLEEESVGPDNRLWTLLPVLRLLSNHLPDGSLVKYQHKSNQHPMVDYLGYLSCPEKTWRTRGATCR